jgi:hypothetical protein
MVDRNHLMTDLMADTLPKSSVGPISSYRSWGGCLDSYAYFINRMTANAHHCALVSNFYPKFRFDHNSNE